MPPGLNRGEKPDKDDNPNPPEVPENPGTEDKSDRKANKGTHIYTYDELNRMVTSNIAKELTTYTYDTLGNLVGESVKNKSVDYQYNELNQLVYRKDSQNQEYTYTYDKRGNRVAETGKKESRAFVYDETNRLVEGTNWKGDKSSYTYNGLGVRINNTQTSHSGSVYSRDYVIDYTSLERDDLMVYAEGGGQLDYVQREVYAGSERIEQFTDRTGSGYERLLYVHEDLQGNTRYYTKDNGQSFAELTYDAWGMPESPNKLLNNDHGNYVYATYTGHIFDTTLDIYFAEARFYDAQTRQWLAMDPIKDGGNWYQYCGSNPLTYWDPLGLAYFVLFGCDNGKGGITADLDRYIINGGSEAELYRILMEITSAWQYSNELVEFVKGQEGIRLEMYNTGQTIGYGFDHENYPDVEINFNQDGKSISIAEADRLLRVVLDIQQEKLNNYLRDNDLYLNQNMYDASMDLLYNRDLNPLTEEIIDAMANQNDEEVLNLFDDFDYRYANKYLPVDPQGYVDRNPGLKDRRRDEYEIYKFGTYN